MTIKRSMMVLFIVLSAFLLLAQGNLFIKAFSEFYNSGKAIIANKIVDKLLDAASLWALERGLTNCALNDENPASPEVIAKIADARKSADSAYNKAINSVGDASLTINETYKRGLTNVIQTLALLRQEVDTNITKPKSARDAALASKWMPGITDVIMESQKLRINLSSASMETSTSLGKDSAIRHSVWLMTEYAGRERGTLIGLIAANNAITPEQLQKLLGFRGKVEEGWTTLTNTNFTKKEHNLFDGPIQMAQDNFFGSYEKIREQVYADAKLGIGYNITTTEWMSKATEAIDTLSKIQIASTTSIKKILHDQRVTATLHMVFYTLSFLMSLAVMAYTIRTVLYKIVHPINEMASIMGGLARGESATIPMLDAKDEIGNIARALNQIDTIGKNALRIQNALDSSSSPVMMLDLSLKITYGNQALQDMVTRASHSISQTITSFNPAHLHALSICDFHEELQHDKTLLLSLSGPYNKTLVIGSHIFEVNASPVKNAKGEALGIVVEWQDMTEIRAEEARKKAALESEATKLAEEEARKKLAAETAAVEAAKNARIKIALDSVSSNVMMADDRHIIIYINPAVLHMLKVAESDIQKELPNFDANKLIGTPIDSFHKDLTLQREMLEKLTSAYSSSITIGGRIFDLITSPVVSEGKRLGTVVEWKDVTLERSVESEIASIVEAVAEGDFTHRLETKNRQGFMLTLCEGMNNIGETSLTGLTETVDVLKALSQGDLTKKITGEYKGMFDDIKHALNNTIDQLYATVTRIKEAAGNVNNASREISSGGNDLSSRTEQQASTLEETAASMEEITAAVKQNTRNSENANTLATIAKDVAEKGGNVVSETVKAMNEIEQSSQKIADIINVIDNIAFQTNLLALNAAVEAARAGDAGKGFAVVASEVRSLAGRSATASKDIKALISESVSQVQSGSLLANQAGTQLEEIVRSIGEVALIISDIASASAEQAGGIGEINTAITQMDEMTQQNATLVEQNTAAAHSLVEQVKTLEKLVSFFTINEKLTTPSNSNASQKIKHETMFLQKKKA